MRTITVFVLLAVALVVSAAVGILVGAVAIAPGDVLSALLGADSTSGTIIRELRLPRVLGAALVGGALAAAGALLQGMLRNPLADPFVTGTSAGASLGAVLDDAYGPNAMKYAGVDRVDATPEPSQAQDEGDDHAVEKGSIEEGPRRKHQDRDRRR